MMKKLLLPVLFLFSVLGFSQDLETIRAQYPKAKDSSEITDQLYEELSEVPEDQVVLSAYKGAVSALKADFAKGVGKKINFIKEGANLLDNAVAAEPDNVEVRYLRLTVQENAPAIVGYHGNIDDDKEVIKKNYSAIKSDSLKTVIKGFVEISSNFDESEKAEFQ